MLAKLNLHNSWLSWLGCWWGCPFRTSPGALRWGSERTLPSGSCPFLVTSFVDVINLADVNLASTRNILPLETFRACWYKRHKFPICWCPFLILLMCPQLICVWVFLCSFFLWLAGHRLGLVLRSKIDLDLINKIAGFILVIVGLNQFLDFLWRAAAQKLIDFKKLFQTIKLFLKFRFLKKVKQRKEFSHKQKGRNAILKILWFFDFSRFHFTQRIALFQKTFLRMRLAMMKTFARHFSNIASRETCENNYKKPKIKTRLLKSWSYLRAFSLIEFNCLSLIVHAPYHFLHEFRPSNYSAGLFFFMILLRAACLARHTNVEASK